jgi:hypothetical protein
MAEPIVRSFVIDTTQAEQNLQRLDVVTTATNASLDGLYNQLIALDAQLQKLDPNSQAFAEVNTQIQQLETTITGIETGKIDDIGKAIESIDAGNAAQSIEQVGDAVQEVVTPVNDLANATDQLNAELKEIPKEVVPDEIVPPDLIPTPVIENAKSLKQQLKELQVQLAATDPKSEKYVELSQRAGELKDAIGDAAEAVGTQAGSAFERLGNSAGLLTGRLANLDFAGAAEGAKLFAQNITSIKFGDITNGIKSLGSTLASVGKALLTNPIFLIGAALAVAISYTSQFITGLDGISEADQKNLAIQQEKAALAKKQVDSISAQENILRQQGVSEREILNMKIKALETAILEQEVVIQTSKTQADAQVKAAERNYNYLKGFLDFVTLPQRKLTEFFFEFYNGAVDLLNKLPGIALEKVDISKVTSTFDDVNKFLAEKLFNPAETKKEADATVAAAEDALINLKNQKAGIQLQIAQQDKTFRDKELEENKKLTDEIIANRRKAYEESLKISKQIREDAAKPIESTKTEISDFDAEIKAQRDAEETRISLMEEGVEKEIALADLKFSRLRDAAGADAELKKQIAQQNEDAVVEIVRTAEEKKRQEQIATVNAGLEWAEKGLNAISALNDVAFANKMSKVKKGSKEEEALAKKQFKFQKALQIGAATIDAAKSVTASLAAAPVAIGPIPNPAGIASLALAITTGTASIAKIAATKFEGGGGGGVDTPTPSIGGGGDTGSQPAQFNPLASSFLQDRPEQLTPRAYVLSGDVASQQEVRTKVEDLARIG